MPCDLVSTFPSLAVSCLRTLGRHKNHYYVEELAAVTGSTLAFEEFHVVSLFSFNTASTLVQQLSSPVSHYTLEQRQAFKLKIIREDYNGLVITIVQNAWAELM